ncbi:unnamed protein product [Spirodela intermedia]|uniref:Uncharacterized protein n=1 Tax=Spirodela intermedia TaxID=51605 RepID=A0A7I8ITK7_SPIIN|nr:unnamed protein product [Spirodela intermedia]CAA6661205.1 unnamed protein product [Spirodela intermedia]
MAAAVAVAGGRAAVGDGHAAVVSGCAAAGDRWQQWSSSWSNLQDMLLKGTW